MLKIQQYKVNKENKILSCYIFKLMHLLNNCTHIIYFKIQEVQHKFT